MSCETFTCMYGFPDIQFKKEYLGDMKLLADAVIANGVVRIVSLRCFILFPSILSSLPSTFFLLSYSLLSQNRIVYHGMPFNGRNTANTFFATVHVGPDCNFAPRLPKFNEYPLLILSPPHIPFNSLLFTLFYFLDPSRYLASVCSVMSEGKPFYQIGVYLFFSLFFLAFLFFFPSSWAFYEMLRLILK